MPLELDSRELQLVGEALRVRPRVLLLGQGYHSGVAGENPLSAALRSRYPNARTVHEWWLSESGPIERRVELLSEAERSVLVSDDLRVCLRQAWTAVFTSAIESLPRSLLEIPERRFVHQFTTAGSPKQSGDSVALYRLFGAVDRSSSAELPPADADALRRRRATATEILQVLAPTTSVRGHVFVDGWDPGPNGDWLRPRDLSAAIATMDSGQVLLFGIGPAQKQVLQADEDLSELLSLGVVHVYEHKLVDVVRRLLAQNGTLTDDDWTTRSADSVLYKVAARVPKKGVSPKVGQLDTVSVPMHQWRRLSAAFTILEDIDQSRPLPVTVEEQRQLFTALCARGPEPALWPWLSSVAFRREALEQAIDQALRLCEMTVPQDHVLLVHGQSGAGKSVLLQLLALELRRLGLPVVFSTRTSLAVDQAQLDDFCALLAQHEATTLPVFLVYDATQSDSDYLELAAFLSGRNRKCVVVGSAFPGQMSGGSTSRRRRSGATVHPVEVSVHLSTAEAAALLEHINRFTGSEIAILRKILGEDVAHFFGALYRLMPDARRNLSAGLIEEVVQGSSRIKKRIEEERKVSEQRPVTLMELKLRAALGVALQAIAESPAKAHLGEESVAAARQLIDAVMVVSRLGLELPQSIALRLIGTNVPAYRSSMSEDIIVEHEFDRGVFTLSARHPLEADIWVRDRVHDRGRQFELIRAMALAINQTEAVQESPELEFVVKILRSVGPEGTEQFRLAQFYERLAGIVSELRLRHDVHPRLLLIEAHTAREWIKFQQRAGRPIGPAEKADRLRQWLKSLDGADDALRHAIDIVVGSAKGFVTMGARRMLTTLATERAAVIGFKLGSTLRLLDAAERLTPARADMANRWLSEARAAWRESLQFDDENFRALHTGSWVISDRLAFGSVDEVEETELLAEWGDLVDRYLDIEVPPSQLDEQDKVEGKFAERCGDVKRFETVMERAKARGSNALFVLVARDLRRREGAESARRYLEQNCAESLLTDRSVVLLYMRVWWESETGLDSFLGKERTCLAFSAAQWAKLEELAAARLKTDGEADHAATHFLRACALLHLGRVEDAAKAYEHVARLGLGGFRRSRSLVLLADSAGKPRLLTAEFQGRRQGAVSLAWCDELRTNVRFQPTEHGLGDPKPGTWLKPFHLALSFRGMFAEPSFRLRESQST